MLQYALYIIFERPFDFSQVRALNVLQKLVDDSFSLPQFLMFFFVLLVQNTSIHFYNLFPKNKKFD